MNPRGTFERVYDAIRSSIETAAFAPGDHLEPAHLADAFNSSITPVRDALQRLVGERLVDATPGDGFRLPVLTEVGLRQLYEWNSQLVQLALKGGGPAIAASPGSPGGPDAADYPALVQRTAALFSAIADCRDNLELLSAIQSMNSRLSLVRHKEVKLVADFPRELASLETLLRGGDVNGLKRACLAYHRRRQKLVDRLVVAVQQR